MMIVNKNWDNIKFPAGNRDIDRLETNNNGLISINVYEPDDPLNEATHH